jgi:hypothetical protein
VTSRGRRTDQFRDEFAAALDRFQNGEGAEDAVEGDDTPEAVGLAAPAGRGAGASTSQVAEDEEAAPGMQGLGFGAALPSAERVRALRDRDLAEKKRRLEGRAAAIQAGLNVKSKGGAVGQGAAQSAREQRHDAAAPMAPPARRQIGAMMPPPAVRGKRARDDAATTGGEGDYEFVPPQDQTGDGKTSLNAKLGY